MVHAITAIILIGMVIFVVSEFLFIKTKDTVVNPGKYLGRKKNPIEIYAAPSNGLFYSPFNIEVVTMENLMLVDIDDDPEYKSIELQSFDDSRGKGARVLLYPHEGLADVYHTSKVFEAMQFENARYVTDPEIEYYFDVTGSGLDASLKMKDRNGKPIEFLVKETMRKKWSGGFLAPIGGSDAVKFSYFPFFHMKNMNFVLRKGSVINISIDGIRRKPKILPIPVDMELVYLSRYSAEPIIANWNKRHNGPLLPFQGSEDFVAEEKKTSYKLVNNSGHYEISNMTGCNENHTVFFDFSPAIPDLVNLKDNVDLDGRFCAGAESIQGIIAGIYKIRRRGNAIELDIMPQKGWQPVPGKLWIKTWKWESTVTVSSDNTVSMESSWKRVK